MQGGVVSEGNNEHKNKDKHALAINNNNMYFVRWWEVKLCSLELLNFLLSKYNNISRVIIKAYRVYKHQHMILFIFNISILTCIYVCKQKSLDLHIPKS